MIEEWKNEPDSEFWMEGEVPCFITRNEYTGTWCAYCAVPKSSPLYGKGGDYSILMTEEMKNRKINVDELGVLNLLLCGRSKEGSATLNMLVRCHGGLSFYDTRESPEIPEEYNSWWWFGFDCGHAYDYQPFLSFHCDDDVYRNIEYTKQCLKNMIEDIKTIEGILG